MGLEQEIRHAQHTLNAAELREFYHEYLQPTNKTEYRAIDWQVKRVMKGRQKHQERLEHRDRRLAKPAPRITIGPYAIPMRFPSFVPDDKNVYRVSIMGRFPDMLIATFVQGHLDDEQSRKWQMITDVNPKVAEFLTSTVSFAQDYATVRGSMGLVQQPDSLLEYVALAPAFAKFVFTQGRNLYRVAKQDGKARAGWTLTSLVLHTKKFRDRYINPAVHEYMFQHQTDYLTGVLCALHEQMVMSTKAAGMRLMGAGRRTGTVTSSRPAVQEASMYAVIADGVRSTVDTIKKYLPGNS